ncbi:MAG: hypothetical protein KC416_05075 [Myxococcales bacterium]|nr:hypothetical protein [Myxococcales bacterium]
MGQEPTPHRALRAAVPWATVTAILLVSCTSTDSAMDRSPQDASTSASDTSLTDARAVDGGTPTPGECDRALRAIGDEWDRVQDDLAKPIQDYTNGPGALYYAQSFVSNFLHLASIQKRGEWLRDLMVAYQEAAPHLKTLSQYPKVQVGTITLSRPMKMWPDKDGVEVVLSSSQFLYAVTLLLHGAGTLEALRDDATAKGFLATYLDVALRDHLLRWIFAKDASHGVFGGRWPACEPANTLFDHSAFIDRLRANTATSYCNAVSDTDLLIASSAVHLLALYDQEPGVFKTHAPAVTPAEMEDLRAYVGRVWALVRSRTVYGTALDETGGTVEVATFDPYGYDAYPDHQYADYTGDKHPFDGQNLPPQPGTGTGWDISHGRRLVLFYDSIRRTGADSLAGVVDPQQVARALGAHGRAMAYRVYRGDNKRAAFANYLDGTDGWYRVGKTAGGVLYGYEPGSWALGRSFLMGGYASWAVWSPRLVSIWNLAVAREDEGESPRYTGIGRVPTDTLQVMASDPALLGCAP